MKTVKLILYITAKSHLFAEIKTIINYLNLVTEFW